MPSDQNEPQFDSLSCGHERCDCSCYEGRTHCKIGHVHETPERGVEPQFDSEQLTVFLDANGRLHVYDGVGIIDVYRLDGIDRAAALDQLRNAIDADYNRELGRGK